MSGPEILDLDTDGELCGWCGLPMPESVADWIVAAGSAGPRAFCTVDCATEWQESA